MGGWEGAGVRESDNLLVGDKDSHGTMLGELGGMLGT